MNKINDEINISIKDMAGYLLSKTLYIIICAVLIGAIGLAYAVYKGGKPSSSIPTESEIAHARAELSETDAAAAERVSRQYISFVEYRDALQKYFDNYLFSSGEDLEGYVHQTTFLALSSKVFGAQRYFTLMALTPEAYERINNALPEEDQLSDIYKRVWIGSDERYSIALLNGEVNEKSLPSAYMINLHVIAKNKEQCDIIEKILEEEVAKYFAELQKLDPDASITPMGASVSEDTSSWVIERQNEAITQLNALETTIKNFNNNQVGNLSASQKNYYNLLIAANADEPQVKSSGPSKKLYLAVGVIAGVVLACAFFVLKYIFSSSIKTKEDISKRYDIPVLNKITLHKKKNLLFDKAVKKLRGINDQDMNSAIEMAASDIGILMEKSGTRSVYLVETAGTDEEKVLSEKLMSVLRAGGIDVAGGQPIGNAKELKEMAAADDVVLLTEIGKTDFDTTDKYYEFFDRYGLNVLGSVVSV